MITSRTQPSKIRLIRIIRCIKKENMYPIIINISVATEDVFIKQRIIRARLEETLDTSRI